MLEDNAVTIITPLNEPAIQITASSLEEANEIYGLLQKIEGIPNVFKEPYTITHKGQTITITGTLVNLLVTVDLMYAYSDLISKPTLTALIKHLENTMLFTPSESNPEEKTEKKSWGLNFLRKKKQTSNESATGTHPSASFTPKPKPRQSSIGSYTTRGAAQELSHLGLKK